MSFESNYFYKFKNFRLDLGETALLKDGNRVSITPKAFHLLRILVENHGTVVKKDTLISEIWDDSFVEEGNLAFTARLLRKVLNDDARNPVFIETVPRKGYRFIADVSKDVDAAEDKAALNDPDHIASSEPYSFRRLVVLAVMAVIVVAASYVLRPYSILTSSVPILSESFRAERLSSTGNAFSSVISPNGKLMAYTDQVNGKWSVWLRLLETAENIQVVAPADVHYGGLVFSRDGNSLFLARADNGTKQLHVYRVNAFGGIPAKIVENTQGWVSVSPDDKQISFVRCDYKPDDYCSLFVADVDGTNERRVVTRAEPIRIADNQFSTDGRSVAFAAGQSWTGSNEFGLFRIDLDTGAESEITPHKFFNIKNIKWLPDGAGILATAREHLAHKFSIWKVDIATGNSTQLTRDDANFSGLSLDGAGTALVATKVDDDFSIYLSNINERLSRKRLAIGIYATFTPDGDVVYQSADRDIWTIDADGGNKRQLTNSASTDNCPLVSRDGRYIFFSSNRSGVNHIWRMNIDGSDPRQITRIEGGYSRFITPDDNWLYYKTGLSHSLRKIRTDGTDEHSVAEIDKFAESFSPDGQFLAYVDNAATGTSRVRIGVRDISGQTLIRVLEIDEHSAQPFNLQWSADGKSIVYVVRERGTYLLWRWLLDRPKPDLVMDLGIDPVEGIAISADGTSIATVQGRWLHDAFLISGLKN